MIMSCTTKHILSDMFSSDRHESINKETDTAAWKRRSDKTNQNNFDAKTVSAQNMDDELSHGTQRT